MKNKHHQYEIVSKNPVAYWWDHEADQPRKVRIVGCDFDKYVDMVCVETGEEIYYKWGYVYNTKEEAELAIVNTKAWLDGDKEYEEVGCINPWKNLLSNKNYAKFKKTKRKQRLAENEWFVAVDDDSYSTSKKFKTFESALRHFNLLKHEDYEFAAMGENNGQNCNMLEWEDGQLWIVDQGRKKNFYGIKYRTIKSRHIGKVETYKQWRK